MFRKNKHIFSTKDEKDKSSVLYQIEKLIKKYPKTILLDEIINTYPKNK